MADEQKTDETEDFIILETPPEDDAGEAEDKQTKDGAGADADDDDEEDEDQRLAHDEGEDDDDASGDSMSFAKKRRLKRKERRRRVLEQNRAREDFLLHQITTLQQQVKQLEGVSYAHSESSIEQQIAEARRQFELADDIMGKAIDAGNGEDARKAMHFRDEAKRKIDELQGVKTQVSTMREQVSQTPVADPRVARNRQDWIDANAEWYDGKNADSQVVKSIDAQIAQAGFDPATPEYWRELTRRTNAYFAAQTGDDDEDEFEAPRRRQPAPKRKAPPTGMTRETTGAGGRPQIYVTPEQKQAMIDAGYWDDPVKRNRVLKRYAEQSRQAAR